MRDFPGASSPALVSFGSAGTVLTMDFIRERNTLLIRGDCGPILSACSHHLVKHRLALEPEQFRMLKDYIAVFALHCASRPSSERLAWTLNFRAPNLTMSLIGDNENGWVTGRIFSGNVARVTENIFCSDATTRTMGAVPRRSLVTFADTDAIATVEHYYCASEQRPARFLHLGDNQIAALISHPDCDEKWMRTVSLSEVRALAGHEILTNLQRRNYRWHCNCNQGQILGVMAATAREDMDAVFGEAEATDVQCPRCAARYSFTREMMETYLATVDQR